MKIQRILSISRPHFWIYEIGPYLLGLASTLPLLNELDVMTQTKVVIFFLYFLIPANIFIYGINDIFDYETDKHNPKKIAYESLLMPSEHASVWKIVLLTSVPFALLLDISNTASIIAFLAFIFFALFYSAKPIRAKVRPGFDMIFSAGHYVATAFFSFALISEKYPPSKALIGGMLWAMAMHAYSAVPDIQADEKSGIKTIATVLKHKPTIILCTLFYTISALIAYSYIGSISLLLLIPYLFLMAISFNSNEERLFTIYTYFPPLNAVIGMVLFFIVIFL